MIQPVSNITASVSFRKTNNQNIKKGQNSSGLKQYTKSFFNHAKESTPMLLGLTAIWAVLDTPECKASIRKSVVNNITGFFLPVLICSSALLAIIENRKTEKNRN